MIDLLTPVSSLAASVLTGRVCEVEYRQPYVKQFAGLAAREGDKAAIHVRPGMDASKALWVLLHECAHIKLHFDTLPQHGLHRQAPKSYKLNNPVEHDTDPREDEAERLARRWYDQAERLAPNSDNVVKLLKLTQAQIK